MEYKYDVLVVGSGTAGIFFAKKMADQGFSVLVIDKLSKDKVGERLNIFHIDKSKFAEFGVPEPKPGDDDYVNTFDVSYSKSALDQHQKSTDYPFVVSLLPKFLKRLKTWAEAVKVKFMYGVAFEDFIYDDQQRIIGAKVKQANKHLQINARLVADCSGIPSVARTKLHNDCKVENFTISSRDMFYVVLRYVTLEHPNTDAVKMTTSWPFYKTWIAPSLKSDGAIYGVGANLSFEYAEKCYAEFVKQVKLPAAKLDKIEKGFTPYHRAPYSLVTDGFICMGDAACMTKPYSGEGITASWVFCKIAADVAGAAMKNNAYPTESSLWMANVRYAQTQGADFASLLATLVSAIDCTAKENNYEFKHNIIFSSKSLTQMNQKFNADMSLIDTIKLAFKILGGVICGGIKFKTVRGLLKGLGTAGKLKKHYRNYPTDPSGFTAWKTKADLLWKRAGSMADKLSEQNSK